MPLRTERLIIVGQEQRRAMIRTKVLVHHGRALFVELTWSDEEVEICTGALEQEGVIERHRFAQERELLTFVEGWLDEGHPCDLGQLFSGLEIPRIYVAVYTSVQGFRFRIFERHTSPSKERPLDELG